MKAEFSTIWRNRATQQATITQFPRPWPGGLSAGDERTKNLQLCSVLSYYPGRLSGSFNWLKGLLLLGKNYFIIAKNHNNLRSETERRCGVVERKPSSTLLSHDLYQATGYLQASVVLIHTPEKRHLPCHVLGISERLK